MENNQRNSRKRLNSLILLVAFTAVMLIVSTYAWFSAQKNVTLGGLKGTVNVAEGLEISLDAKYWSQEVDFGDTNKYATQDALKKLYAIDTDLTDGKADEKTLQDTGTLANTDPEHNIIPTELLPVSTTGRAETASGEGDADGIGLTDMKMYRGININTDDLYQIIQVKQATDDADNTSGRVYTGFAANGATDVPVDATHHDYPGYYAIDLFLRNSTKDVSLSDDTDTDGHSNFNKTNTLQLNANSKLELQSSASNSTGLQNTVRVAFALYNMTETYDQLSDYTSWGTEDQTWNNLLSKTTTTASAYMTASQQQILNAYNGTTINDVAIWEPNASDHVQTILDMYNPNYEKVGGMKWSGSASTGDIMTYGIGTDTGETLGHFALSNPLPTYALTNDSVYRDTDYDLAMADGSDTGTVAGDSNTDTNSVQVGEGTGVEYKAGITDIYDWKTPYATLQKQVTLQTEKTATDNYAVGKVKQLISVKSTAANRYSIGTESGATAFSIPSGKVCKVRMYVWLEGQDVDTRNNASHGGGVYLDVGLIKDATAQS